MLEDGAKRSRIEVGSNEHPINVQMFKKTTEK